MQKQIDTLEYQLASSQGGDLTTEERIQEFNALNECRCKDYENVTRLEVIDEGRQYVSGIGIEQLEFSLQDGGKTLKIFVTKEEECPCCHQAEFHKISCQTNAKEKK